MDSSCQSRMRCPGDEDYSPIWESNFVTWNDNATARELKSVEEILAAEQWRAKHC